METITSRLFPAEAHIARALQILDDRRVFRRVPEGTSRHMRTAFRSALLFNEQLTMVAYWGVGRKNHVTLAEKNAVEFMQNWIDRLASALELNWHAEFLLADTHANVNRIPVGDINGYCASAVAALQSSKLTFRRMTDFLRLNGIEHPIDVARNWDASETSWPQFSKTTQDELVRLAGLHGTPGPATEVAKLYVNVCTIESVVITRHYANSIFVTYNVPAMGFLLPSLPIIHAYVGPNHLTKRPWFDTDR